MNIENTELIDNLKKDLIKNKYIFKFNLIDNVNPIIRYGNTVGANGFYDVETALKISNNRSVTDLTKKLKNPIVFRPGLFRELIAYYNMHYKILKPHSAYNMISDFLECLILLVLERYYNIKYPYIISIEDVKFRKKPYNLIDQNKFNIPFKKFFFEMEKISSFKNIEKEFTDELILIYRHMDLYDLYYESDLITTIEPGIKFVKLNNKLAVKFNMSSIYVFPIKLKIQYKIENNKDPITKEIEFDYIIIDIYNYFHKEINENQLNKILEIFKEKNKTNILNILNISKFNLFYSNSHPHKVLFVTLSNIFFQDIFNSIIKNKEVDYSEFEKIIDKFSKYFNYVNKLELLKIIYLYYIELLPKYMNKVFSTLILLYVLKIIKSEIKVEDSLFKLLCEIFDEDPIILLENGISTIFLHKKFNDLIYNTENNNIVIKSKSIGEVKIKTPEYLIKDIIKLKGLSYYNKITMDKLTYYIVLKQTKLPNTVIQYTKKYIEK